MRGTQGSWITVLGAAVVAGLCVLVPAVSAAELSHEAYLARVEPICKANTEANKQIFTGAKGEVQSGELTKASKRFKRATAALAKTIKQVKAVPQPVEDQAKLVKWLGYLEAENGLIGKIGKALGEGDKYKAQNLSVRLRRNSNLANNTVLGFGFEYCRIDPTRFA